MFDFEFHICDVAASAHRLGEFVGFKHHGRVDGQVEGLGNGRTCGGLVAFSSDGDGVNAELFKSTDNLVIVES